MLERCGYRAALYLSALIAVVNWSFFTYVQWYLPRFGDGAAIYAVGAVLVLVGLWLRSKIARYVGAAFYFLLAGVVAFNISGLGKQVSVGRYGGCPESGRRIDPHFLKVVRKGICR